MDVTAAVTGLCALGALVAAVNVLVNARSGLALVMGGLLLLVSAAYSVAAIVLQRTPPEVTGDDLDG